MRRFLESILDMPGLIGHTVRKIFEVLPRVRPTEGVFDPLSNQGERMIHAEGLGYGNERIGSRWFGRAEAKRGT
jgi:hypothetical protein